MRSATHNISFWDAEEESTSDIKVRDTVVGPISSGDVKEFCRRYHYTSHGGADMWRWGLWHGVTLLGVVSYNNGTRTSAAAVFGEEHKQHVWHMGRLALADLAPRNSESRLIAGSIKAISRDHPDVWSILTFAAADAGHLGYVYQATNALYTGTGGNSAYYITPEGTRVTDRPGRQSLSKSEIAQRGWVQHDALPKHRYVYILGSKTQRKQRRRLLKLPVLPYPKEATR